MIWPNYNPAYTGDEVYCVNEELEEVIKTVAIGTNINVGTSPITADSKFSRYLVIPAIGISSGDSEYPVVDGKTIFPNDKKGGGRGVDIDNQTIIKGEDGKIRTAVGGYVEAIATDVTILNSTVVVDEDDDNEWFEVDNQYDRHLIYPGATYVVTMNGERFVCEGLVYDATENYITWGDDEYYLYEGYDDGDFVWYMQLYAPSGTYNLKIEGDIFGDTHYINNAYINDDIARSDQITDLPFLSAIYRFINTNKTYYKTFDPSVVAVLKQITTITSTSITWDGDKTDKTKLGEFYKIGELPNALNAILAAYGNSTPLIFRRDQDKNVLFTSPTGSGGILIIKTTGGVFSHTVLKYRNNKWDSWSASLLPEETGIYVSSDIRNVTLETT